MTAGIHSDERYGNMSDIVERLREKRGIMDNRWPGPSQLEQEAADEIERLRCGWQPIKTAPKEGWIIGATSWGQQVGKLHQHVGPCEWYRDHFEFANTDFDVFPRPTHWQPWPAPPVEQAKTEVEG
jgi:hypothetical protein